MTTKMNNVGNDTKIENSAVLAFACGVCGWIFNGSEKDFNDLPVEYNCLKCGATKVNFKPFDKKKLFGIEPVGVMK